MRNGIERILIDKYCANEKSMIDVTMGWILKKIDKECNQALFYGRDENVQEISSNGHEQIF